MAEEEQKLNRRIDDKNRKIEIIVDDVLELLLFMIHEKEWYKAEELLENLSKRDTFRTLAKSPVGKGSSGIEYLYLNQVPELGKAILLAYQDNPAKSNQKFLEVFVTREAKGLTNQITLFFKKHPQWRKAIGDALHRNVKNLQTNPEAKVTIDPILEYYRLPRITNTTSK
jgi:hypothetical protein